MTDPELIRWAAELCGWNRAEAVKNMSRASWDSPCDSAGIIDGEDNTSALSALMADLLVKFVEATPEPRKLIVADITDEWQKWRIDREKVVERAIPQGPLATIRAIHETGVLS